MRARLIIGTLTDGLGLVWQLLALNTRKSWWIIRRRQAGHPCQHPSDSGRAGESECDACKFLHSPGRLRVVCPLLQSTKAGWMCSVDAASVRPYWARSITTYLCLLLGLYLSAATATFAGMRAVGYPGLSWWQVAWPGAWTQVSKAQSRGFLEKAGRLFQAGRPGEALLSISTAVQSDPSNLEPRLLLAQIWSLQGNFDFAGKTFDELEKQFPDQQRRIALTRHDTLVTIGQGRRLAEYALAKTRTDRNQFAFWIQSLLLGLQLSRQAESFAAAAQADIAALPEYPRRLIEMETLIQQGRTAEAKAWLVRPFAGPWNAIYARLQVEMLMRLGAMREAVSLLNHYGLVLGNFQRDLLHFAISKSSGDEISAQADLHGLLAERLGSIQVDYLCAVLVRTPDRFGVTRLQVLYGTDANSLPRETATAIWLVATLAGEKQIAEAWVPILKTKGVVPPEKLLIDFSATEFQNPNSVPFLINALPLPRDVVQALALRVKRK